MKMLAGLALIVVVAQPGAHSLASPQDGPALSALTVPEANLPVGCRVRTSESATSAVTVSPASTTRAMTLSPGPFAPFPGNPWVGSDRKLLALLLGTATAVPDGPPPSAAELSRMEARRTEHVREGYRALYDAPAGGRVQVQAVRFDTPDRAAAERTPEVHRLLHPTGQASDQIVTGAVLIVAAGAESDCYRAVVAHLRAAK